MKHTFYKTQGTCSQYIDVTVDEQGVIREVSFAGGCGGNLQAVCRLVTGQKADEVIKKLKGIRCGDKPTSCPDQLCRALEQLQHSKE